jgi:cytochrome c nitrite reductase small subunit
MSISPRVALLAGLVGAGLGVGGFTFRYAEGLSYMSNDPRACKNCHIMNEQYDAWRKSSHHAAATCNDCHVPIDFLGKYLAKASNGYHHSKGFTFQDFHEPILIKPKNSQILQDNCLRCHGALVHDIVRGSTSASGAIRCVHCHRGVGHSQ